MAWTIPRTWLPNDPLNASDFNTQFRDNLNYLLSARAFGVKDYDPGTVTTVTTSSTAFVDADATNMKVTIAPKSTRVLVLAAFTGQTNVASFAAGQFNIHCDDGSDLAAGFGLMAIYGTAALPVMIHGLKTGLTSGATYNFMLRYRTGGYGSNTVSITIPVLMLAIEV